ncbi:MAG: hypothetical protein NC320_01615 [Clostridium sp.]|nr:hypothetical protein [Clostridium sp.]
MIEVNHICDMCGNKMSPIKSVDDLVPKSATQEWNLRLFDICPMCALKLDNEFLKMKLQLVNV